jgi:hypothetical protein
MLKFITRYIYKSQIVYSAKLEFVMQQNSPDIALVVEVQ